MNLNHFLRANFTNLFFSILFLAIVGCSSSTKNTIQVEIPANLKGNAEVENYISEYASTVGDFIALVNEFGINPNGNEPNLSNASNISTVELVKVTRKLSKITDKIETYKNQKALVSENLSDVQKASLNALCYELEAHMGQLNSKPISIDESEIVAINQIQNKKQNQAQHLSDSLDQLRGEPLEGSTFEENLANNASANNELSIFKIMLFALAFIGAAALGIWQFIKGMKSKVSEIGYAVGNAKTAVSRAKEMADKTEPNGEKMTDAEKKGLEFLDKHLNNISNKIPF